MPSPDRARALEGLAVLGVAVVCVGFQLRLPTVLPSETDYQAVREALNKEAQPGDALLLAPWWTERARVFAPPALTVVGYQGSDTDDLDRHPRIWVLSQPSLPRSDVAGFHASFDKGRTPVGSERTFGPLHLQLFQNGRHRPVRFDFAAALERAQVYLEGPDGARMPCNWDGRAHRCPGGNYVAPEWHEIRFQPKRCVRLFPPGGPSKLVMELSALPAADAVVLQGGFIWDRGYFHEDRLTDTRLQLDINGTAAASIDFPKARFGLQRALAPAVPEGATIRVWSQAQNPETRELCVEAYGVGAQR